MSEQVMPKRPHHTAPLNVAFCENGAGYGGAIISLAAFLENIPADFTPHIYTSLGTAPYQRLQRLGRWRHLAPVSLLSQSWMQRHQFPFASPLDNVFNLLPYALRYYRAFRRDRIDLVYLNNDCSCNLAAAIGARLAGLPTVLHARGFNADTRGNRWVLQQLDHCLPVSRAVRDELLGLGLPLEKCTVVPEGLDLTQFYPRPPSAKVRSELGLTGAEPVITLVGGLIDWKGQDVLLEAAPAILARYPMARILLVGSAYGRDSAYAEMIRRKASNAALGGSVHMLGARDDIPDILSASSIVLHASTTPEPFGRTFLEGMAMGKPTIASNEGGPLDVIEHDVDGILVEPRNPALLAASILRLLDNADASNMLGRHGAAKARNYSIASHTSAIATVLRHVREGHSGTQVGS